ncbi:MAG: glycosyltransferase family 2 protein [Candidatus Dojkabacteria bacterium]
MKFSIIIPAKDEVKRLQKTLLEFANYFNKASTEIIVVVNNSSDNTLQLAIDCASKFSNIKVLEVNKRDIPYTKGLAVKVGLEIASGKYVGYVDADNSTTPAETDRLFRILEKSDYDSVIGNRYIAGSHVYPKQPLTRILFSRSFNTAVKLLFGLHSTDTQCGAKFFKANVAKHIASNLLTYGWIFDVDVLSICKNAGFTVNETPTE